MKWNSFAVHTTIAPMKWPFGSYKLERYYYKLSYVIHATSNKYQFSFTTIDAGYSPGDRRLAGYSDNTSGGECLLGYKMVLYIQSTDPPTTTERLTTSITLATTTSPLTTTTLTTGIRVVPTEGDMNNTTSGTVTLFNLNYLTIIALLSLWHNNNSI